MYSVFSNEYVLTKELCGEAEVSRIDVGLLYILSVVAAVVVLCFQDISGTAGGIGNMLHAYFSSPSADTVLELSGVGAMMIGTPLGLLGAGFALYKSFPKLVGEKRFQEQISFVPSAKRRVEFYDEYVEVRGKFSRKLPYKELRRIGETRNLYLLYFTDKRIVFLHKAGFCKGRLADLKSFLRERRTRGSKIYGVIRYLPVICVMALFTWIIWMEM